MALVNIFAVGQVWIGVLHNWDLTTIICGQGQSLHLQGFRRRRVMAVGTSALPIGNKE
jgi:hypothetical protein